MNEDRHVVYINWDGFAKYYYDIATKRGLIPVLDRLRDQGVFFENAWCGLPAITNPMQTAISSGAYAGKTGNVKLHYDRKIRQVIDQRHENRAENLAQSFWRQGLSVASIHHFTFEENGTYAGDKERPYIATSDSNFIQRFSELYRLLASEKVHTGNTLVELGAPPRFIAVYMDDLDTVGHNNGKLAPAAASEEGRIENVLWRLNQMDSALGIFLEKVSALPICDRLSFFLITDHGMTPFAFSPETKMAYEYLLAVLKDRGYRYEVLVGGQSPDASTDVVLCSAGLSLMLTFTEAMPISQIASLKEELEGKWYVGKVMTGREIAATGSMDFCDLYISPAIPYIFKDAAPAVGATHDSLDDSALRIFSLMWGNGIRKNTTVDTRIRNIDFAPTMAKLLDAEAPAQNEGRLIAEALEEE
ncbi:alkaline phosphatase family protein [Parasphaerochaeta coccoides]|uniref:Type I phosphodiesterase/nucleotide pyrophosphatase n=1 Tax=Parasphaerochaeta coccoides (strain ATCC BAA-1237 / DSM 17374 / SPN1) TaxID=760011 RepID=F4GJ83_PARC1|nr:alkaline phosphatase family protein [Parasphaerochaeta coccoides]AEC01723.1 type I phosphodiesterase/nucleotide pyrophosphatase [Parasphaerochaeta coccoides DSM 17374]